MQKLQLTKTPRTRRTAIKKEITSNSGDLAYWVFPVSLCPSGNVTGAKVPTFAIAKLLSLRVDCFGKKSILKSSFSPLVKIMSYAFSNCISIPKGKMMLLLGNETVISPVPFLNRRIPDYSRYMQVVWEGTVAVANLLSQWAPFGGHARMAEESSKW